MTNTFNAKNSIITLSGTMYFVALAMITQSNSVFVQYFWYLSIALGAAVSLIVNISYFRKCVILFAATIIATGLINYFLIGSIQIKSLVVMMLIFLLSFLFVNERFNPDAMITVIVMNAVIIIFKFLTVGIRGQIYLESSVNYISVYMLYPTVIYYTLVEARGKKLHLWPALLLWILSMIASGRGGIISSSILLLGIAFFVFRKMKREYRAIIIPVLIVVCGVFLLCLDKITGMFGESVASETFRDRGMKSSRTELWADYLRYAFADIEHFLFGADIRLTLSWERYLGNAHNSYISVHANNGIFCLIWLFGLVFKRGLYTLKNKRFIYLICLGTLLIRAFTDTIFWMNYGTAALFFMLFMYGDPAMKKKVSEKKTLVKVEETKEHEQ